MVLSASPHKRRLDALSNSVLLFGLAISLQEPGIARRLAWVTLHAHGYYIPGFLCCAAISWPGLPLPYVRDRRLRAVDCRHTLGCP